MIPDTVTVKPMNIAGHIEDIDQGTCADNNQEDTGSRTIMSKYPRVTVQMIVDTILLLAMLGPLTALNMLGQPIKNGFWCNDQSISLPYKPDSVSKHLLLLLSVGGPLLVICLTESIRTAYRSKTERHLKTRLPLSVAKAYGVFLFGLAADCFLTEMLKYSVGRLRPHFLDVCRPNLDKVNCTSIAWPMTRFVEGYEYECMNDDVDPKVLRDSRLSFPSGHASVSVYSALFSVFYLQLRMSPGFSHLLRPMLQLGLVLMATFCCVSRLTDHKHFVSDIAAGASIGSALAWLTFYKLGHRVIPDSPPPTKPRVLPRALSVESEPQTPTPLLRPAAYVQVRRHDFADKV